MNRVQNSEIQCWFWVFFSVFVFKSVLVRVEKHMEYIWCGCGFGKTCQPLCDKSCQNLWLKKVMKETIWWKINIFTLIPLRFLSEVYDRLSISLIHYCLILRYAAYSLFSKSSKGHLKDPIHILIGSLKGGPVRYIAPETKDVWFCNCKQTENRPFCDGSHRKEKSHNEKGQKYGWQRRFMFDLIYFLILSRLKFIWNLICS